MPLAERIAKVAEKIGGVRALSEAISVHENTLYKPAKGFSGAKMAEIVAATGCSPAYLLLGLGEPFPPADPETKEGRATAASLADKAAVIWLEATELLIAALPFVDGDFNAVEIRQMWSELDSKLGVRKMQATPPDPPDS